MTWVITYITWIHFITAIISLQLFLVVQRMQPFRGKSSFLLMIIFSFAWSIILTFESVVPTIPEKVMWSEFEYFCNMGLSLLFFQFILSYNLGKRLWIERRFWILLLLPLITLILVFTNDFHHLIWTGYSWSPEGNNILIYHHGPFFYIAMAYSTIVAVSAIVLLISFIRQRPRFYKHKAGYLITGSLFPLFSGIIYTTGLSQGVNISPIGLLFTGFIFFWGISRGQLFDIVPAGHRLMIETMPDGVIVLDPNNFIMDVNPSVMKSLKIQDNIIGQKLEMAIPGLEESLKKLILNPESRLEIFLESPVACWFEVMLTPLRNNKRTSLGSLLILHDISHRKRTELQLKKLAGELTELNATKDRLYSIIGHDLRSPFNSILGFSGLLVESYDDLTDDERKQYSENIYNTSRSAYKLLENLLEWSRLQLDRSAFAPEELNLNLFVNEVINQIQGAATGKNITLLNSVSSAQVVYADKNMLSTILRNLISNGIKFTYLGGRVEVSATAQPEGVEICVADNGTGIPKKAQEELYHPDILLSTPGTQNEKGTGLGLILCKEFIGKHNGTNRLESEEGKGSRFYFTLPNKKDLR